MFARLKILYEKGVINEVGLTKAIEKGWITEDQKQQIVSAQ